MCDTKHVHLLPVVFFQFHVDVQARCNYACKHLSTGLYLSNGRQWGTGKKRKA